MLTAAYRGRDEQGRRLIAEARTQLSPASRGIDAVVVELAELVLGRNEDALSSCRRVLELHADGWVPWALPELVEAAARAGAGGGRRRDALARY